MSKIIIILSSIRTGRKSDRVAKYFEKFIIENNLAEVEIADLKSYNFPLFEERLKFMENPDKKVIEFANKIKSADGVIIVTPEYNGGYPASLKNVIDLLNDEWVHKPVAISMVSSGMFGGSQVITSLQFTLWKMKVLTCNAMFPVAKVSEAFAEDGTPSDVEATNKRAMSFINELVWNIQRNK